MQGDVWGVTQQSAITFEPMGTMGSPAYGHVGLTMENLFKENLCGYNGFECPKTQNVQKIGEIL